MYRCLMDRPGKTDSPAIRTEKERELSTAFMQYLSSTGDTFTTFEEEREEWELIMVSHSIIVDESFG